MTDKERYLFDLQGFLAVPDALSPDELVELNAILDKQIAQHTRPEDARKRFGGLLSWGTAYQRLIDNPRITPYLNELIGPDFRLDHNYADLIRRSDGPIGAMLHGGGTPFDSSQFFRYHDGRMFNGLTVVAYNLMDVNPGDC